MSSRHDALAASPGYRLTVRCEPDEHALGTSDVAEPVHGSVVDEVINDRRIDQLFDGLRHGLSVLPTLSDWNRGARAQADKYWAVLDSRPAVRCTQASTPGDQRQGATRNCLQAAGYGARSGTTIRPADRHSVAAGALLVAPLVRRRSLPLPS